MFDGTFESIKNNLFMRLFNKHNLPLNRKLDDVPHINYIDLAVTFSIEERTYINKNKGIYSYLITNEDMEMLKVDERTLREVAMKNLLDKNSPRIETINQHSVRNHVFRPLTRIPNNAPTVVSIDGPKSENHNLFDGNEYGQIPIINNLILYKDLICLTERLKVLKIICS